jgi:Skp family chaperone for outer membrane proteins
MFSKFSKFIVPTIVVVNSILIVFFLFKKEEVGFVDYNTVYNNCKLKQSLEKDLQMVTNSRKHELDSMQIKLTFLSNDVNSGKASNEKLTEFEDMKNMYMTLQENYEQENIRLKETYFGQIRKEINDKAKAYASAHGFDYLFAAMGDGALMYGAEAHDCTKEFQHFLDQE